MIFLPNSQASLPSSFTLDISLEVEFSTPQKVTYLEFHFPPHLEAWLSDRLADFQAQAAGLSLKEALNLPWRGKSYFPIPHWLLFRAYQNWVGDIPHWEDAGERLLCRCFAVSIESVQEFCQQKINPGPREVADALKAGIGCGTCLNDLRALLISLRRPWKTSSKRIRIGGKSPLQVMDEAHSIGQSFQQKRSDLLEKIEVLELRGRQLLFSWQGKARLKNWMAELESELVTHFRDEIILVPWTETSSSDNWQ